MKRRVMIVLGVVSVLIFAAVQTTGAQGLKLDETLEKEVEGLEKANPHSELDCTDCHLEAPDAAPGEGDRTQVKFTDNLSEDKLCFQCHDEGVNLHPIYKDPKTADPPVEIPELFPLGAVGDAAGKVICTTCHFIHVENAGFKLLRGFPLKPGDKEAKFTERNQFCKACHGEDLIKKSPHLGKKEGEKGCSFCHTTAPKAGEEVEFKMGIVALCNFCHAATGGGHFLKVNPFADPNLQDEIPNLTLPMIGGEYTCVTCHEPHGGTTEPAYLRDEYVDFAVKSRRIRPHFQDTFCRTCHQKKPEKGGTLAAAPLLHDNPTDLCNRCHASGLAVSDIHPLAKVMGKFVDRIPADWPLYNGNLSCITCHTPGDRVEFDPGNPNFLRGAPYQSRNEPCWNCHKREEFAELDPHEKIQDLAGCEFCHQKEPDLDKGTEQRGVIDFKGDINLLCIRCHDEIPHPANIDHTGVPNEKWLSNIDTDKFPLDKIGRMVCSTCHDPHDASIGEGKLRGAMAGMMICSYCHKM